MRVLRPLSLVGIFVGAVVLAVPPSAGQSPPDLSRILKPYSKTVDLGPQTASKVREMMNARIRILNNPDEKRNLEYLDEFARHYAYKLTQERYYGSGSLTGELAPRRSDETLDGVFNDLRGYLLVPRKDNVSKMTVDNANYIKEFGAALDRSLVPLLKAEAPLLRVNAARMLALVSATGAPGHAKTISALLNDPNTPPEVLIHAYQAAEAFLSAYDAFAVGRADSNRHAGNPADVIELVRALERHIVFDGSRPGGPVADKVASVAPPPKSAPPEAGGAEEPGAEESPTELGVQPATGRLEASALTPEQERVIRYFRRQAVRAMAKIRFDIMGGRNEIPEVRPAFTLARVAIADKAINPPPSFAERADAVIGLCGMSLSPPMNVDVLAEAMAAGLVDFAAVKNQNRDDRSIPWRMYGNRLSAAFDEFRASPKVNAKANSAVDLIASLTDAVNSAVISRLNRPDNEALASPDVERLRTWVQQNRPRDQSRQLFSDASQYKLDPRPQ